MKKLLLCALTSASFYGTIKPQDDSKVQESLEKLHGTVAQVEDQLKHINEKLNVLQSGNETTTSKLTETLSQLSQIQMHLTQPKNDQVTTPSLMPAGQQHDMTPSTPTSLPEQTPTEPNSIIPATPSPVEEVTNQIEPVTQDATTEQPTVQQQEQPHEATLLSDIGIKQPTEQPQNQPTESDSDVVNTEATIL